MLVTELQGSQAVLYVTTPKIEADLADMGAQANEQARFNGISTRGTALPKKDVPRNLWEAIVGKYFKTSVALDLVLQIMIDKKV